MKVFTYSIIFFSFFLFCFFFFPSSSFAEETGFLFPTTCQTDGSSCDNMQSQDTSYNSWINTLSSSIIVTFTNFGIPRNALIDDIQIKMRIRTDPQGGWTWFPYASANGTNYYRPIDCTLFSFCQYNTTPVFNPITNSTFIWTNNNPTITVTGDMINSPSFRFQLLHTTSIGKNTDIDVLLFNVRYHIVEPTETPLIFIPGIGGSELKAGSDILWSSDDGHGGTFTHSYPKDETIWVNTAPALVSVNDDYFDVLRMQLDGTSEANIVPTGNLFSAYQPTIDFFTSHGYTLNTDFFIFPYDWRKDITETKALLDEKVADIKQKTGAQKVDIVAHSMGGLVARNYIADTTKAQNVRKLLTLGTPYLGAVKFLKALNYGDCLTILELFKKPACLGVTPSEVKDVFRNAIGGYELAPSQKYFSFYNNSDNYHPYPFVDNRDMDNDGITGPLDYSQIKTLLTNLHYNTNLFTPTETFHSLDNTLATTNGVDTTVIAGSGIATLGQIVEKNVVDFLGITIPKKDELTINGDETVPLLSASLTDPTKNMSLLGNAKVYYTKQTHGNLTAPGPAMELVNNILADNTQLPTGVSQQAFPFSGTSISSHSPVNLHVYDAYGNHTGTIPDGFEENIPGSHYDTLDDAKFVFLPEEGVYTIRLDATDKGSFDLLIRDYANNENTKTTFYKNVPIQQTTKVETLLDTTTTQPPALAVDQNGDGQVDSEVNATSQAVGEENDDHLAPITVIQADGIKGTNDWFTSAVTVTLDATDDSSGVASTTYTVDNGTNIKTYTEPFSITNDGVYTVKAKSVDNAGNEENPQEIIIKIDKTPPEAKIFVDQDLQDVVVQGIDSNPTSVARQDNPFTKKKDDALFVITDIAGNSLKLDVRDRDKDKQDKFDIYSLTYNTTSPFVLDTNHYTVTYQGKKAKLNLKEQNFDVKGDVKIRIQYDAKKDKSTIITKEGKQEKVKEVRSGVTILQLLTTLGGLQYSY